VDYNLEKWLSVRALEEPLRQIAENAGLEGSVVVNAVRKAKKGHGLNTASIIKNISRT